MGITVIIIMVMEYYGNGNVGIVRITVMVVLRILW